MRYAESVKGTSPHPMDGARSAVVDQLMVNGADAATSYGVVLLLLIWTMYEPGSTLGGPDALMSPIVSASLDTENETVTFWDCPAASVTRVKPTSRCGGT